MSTQPRISAQPTPPTPLPPPNETLPQRQSLLQGQSIYRNLTLLHLRILLTIYCFVAWPQIRPAIKVEKISKFPGWLIKYMNLLISHFSFINYYVSTLFILSWHFSQYITQK